MILAPGPAPFPLEAQTINTLITVLGTIAVAVVGGTFAILQARRKKPEIVDPEPAGAPSPLANFSGTQNEFMALVIRDNEVLREEIRRLAARTEEAVATAEAARKAARETQDLHTEFQRAVRRYLEDLAAAWTGPVPMPYPNENDFGLLEHTLPRLRRRGT